MDNQQSNEPRKPWYVRYYLIPDSKKPRTALMGLAHGYLFLWFSFLTLAFLFGGIAGLRMIPSDPFNGIVIALICFGIAYGGFWFLKRENSRDKIRRNQK